MYIARQRGQVRIIPPRVRRPLQRPAQMGFLPFILPAIGLGTQIFGKLFTGGKGHQCSKTATDPESFLACWPYKPIPDNYVPYDAGGGKGWDWTFYYGAQGGRPNPGQDPNIAVSQDEVKAWTAAGVPIACDAQGICRRTDGGGQAPGPVGPPVLPGQSDATAPAATGTGLSAPVKLPIVGSVPMWGLIAGGGLLAVVLMMRR